MLAAEVTKVVAIGISVYEERDLALEFGAANAQALTEALQLESSCAIPAENLTLICDQAASRESILQGINKAAASCSPDGVLIVYFSGHGEQANSQFYLLPVDVSTGQLEHTAISGDDLQRAISPCRARGILIILDCCKSAGFAENAQSFFTTLAGYDFRLLLSASRAGQPSFEFRESKGTLFTRALVRVVRGEAGPLGSVAGVVYFSDLLEYIQKQVAEDLESLGNAPTAQEPVFAGTYNKDPRLFVLKRLSLERLEAEAPRYSRKYLRRRLARLAGLAAGLVLVFLAAYYFYLDHSLYVWHESSVVKGREGDFLSIYAGDPRFNWLGFPHRVLTTDINAGGLDSKIRPGVGTPLRAPWSNGIEPLLFSQLSPEWQTAVSAWKDDAANAWKYAKAIDIDDDPDASGVGEAAEALGWITTEKDVPALEELTAPDADISTPPVLRRIATLAPEHALDLLGDGLDEPRFGQAVLEGLSACRPAVASFLAKEAPTPTTDGQIHNAWFEASIRTGCPLSSELLLRTLDIKRGSIDRQLDWLPLLALSPPADFGVRLGSELKRSIEELAMTGPGSDRYFPLGIRVWVELRTAAALWPNEVPSSAMQLLSFPYSYVRFAAALALSRKAPAEAAHIAGIYGGDPWVLSGLAWLASNGWFEQDTMSSAIKAAAAQSKSAQGQYSAASVMFFLRTVRLRRLLQAESLVRELMASEIPEIKLEALRTLDGLARPAAARESMRALDVARADSFSPIRIEGLTKYSLLRGTYAWWVRNDVAALANFLKDLGENPDEAAEVLGRTAIPARIQAELRRDVGKEGLSLKAVTLLAMRGSVGDLGGLLDSADVNIRNQGMLYATYNPVVPQYLSGCGGGVRMTMVCGYLNQQRLKQGELERMGNKVPVMVRGIAFSLMGGLRPPSLAVADDIPDVSPGLRLWLADRVDELEGRTADQEERGLDNSPKPAAPRL
jgi:Caspase domain